MKVDTFTLLTQNKVVLHIAAATDFNIISCLPRQRSNIFIDSIDSHQKADCRVVVRDKT